MELFATVFLILCATTFGSKTPVNHAKFSPCKGTRTLNPMETMKARGLAARMGAKCVGSQLVEFISKHHVPTFAFPPLAKMMCQATLVAYGRFSDKVPVLSKGTTAEELVGLFRNLIRILELQNWTVLDKTSGKVFKVPGVEMAILGQKQLECAMTVQKDPVRDADWILYIVNHVLRLLSKT